MPVRNLYVPNGLFFIHDAKRPKGPEFIDAPFYFNHGCIVVRARHEQEGQCKVTLEATERLPPLRRPDLVRPIRTQRRRVLVTLVPGNAVMAISVAADVTFISIWTDGSFQSEEVIIGVGGGLTTAKRNLSASSSRP